MCTQRRLLPVNKGSTVLGYVYQGEALPGRWEAPVLDFVHKGAGLQGKGGFGAAAPSCVHKGAALPGVRGEEVGGTIASSVHKGAALQVGGWFTRLSPQGGNTACGGRVGRCRIML